MGILYFEVIITESKLKKQTLLLFTYFSTEIFTFQFNLIFLKVITVLRNKHNCTFSIRIIRTTLRIHSAFKVVITSCQNKRT